jgi:hypothetical protein
MDFEEHGIFQLKVENKILHVDATGPFNGELINHYNKSLEKCIQLLEDDKWNQIIVLHKMSLFTPEAEEALTKTLIERKSRGLTNCAVVINDVDCKMLVKEQLGNCYEKAQVNYDFFTSNDDAIKWLNSL